MTSQLHTVFVILFVVGCGDNGPDAEDNLACTDGNPLITIAAVGDATPTSTDQAITGSLSIPDDVSVRSVDVGVVATVDDPQVYGIPAAIVGTTWSATVTIDALLAPHHGGGMVMVVARAATNCKTDPTATTPSFAVMPPPMVDAATGSGSGLVGF
jgi:hypothetical protein